MKNSAIKVLLEAFWETGTEGVYWSVTDPSLPGYDALTPLKDGDKLTVFDDEFKEIWSGVVELEYETNFKSYPLNPSQGQQAVAGYWVHGLQKDLDPDFWASMFTSRKRAIAEIQVDNREQHPFKISDVQLKTTLENLNEKHKLSLFQSSLYPWLSFYSDGTYSSLGKELGLTYEEILQCLGNPTEEQILAHKTYPKNSTEMLLPYSLDMQIQLAKLFKIYGWLVYKFTKIEDRKKWLETYNTKLNHSPIDLLCGNLSDLTILNDHFRIN